MASEHDAIQQARYLRQILAQDKRPLGLLLGAGCPFSLKPDGVEPLIPDIEGLTTVVRTTLEDSGIHKPLITRLLANLVDDGKAKPNVEDYLGHVRGLRAVAGSQDVRSFKTTDLDELDRAISKAIVDTVARDLPTDPSPYLSMAGWTQAIAREHPVHVFTTNYDLLIEQAFERAHVPFFDGFVGAHRPFFDPFAIEEDRLPSRWARVWKLHGSINWRRTDDGKKVTRADGANGDFVIHPSHLKYEESRRMPYLAMLDRVRSFLRQPDATLIACGYRFGDEHLNDLLVSGLRGNTRAAMYGLLYSGLDKYASAVALTRACPSLTLLAEDGAVLGTKRSSWRKLDVPSNGAPDAIAYSIAKAGNATDGTVSFRLGDFVHFGKFLDDLIREQGADVKGIRAD